MLHGNEKHFNKLASSLAVFKAEGYLFKGRNKWPRFKILRLAYLSKRITNAFLAFLFERYMFLFLNVSCFKKKLQTPAALYARGGMAVLKDEDMLVQPV